MLKEGFGYIRVSGDSQSEGDGPARQQEKITKAASTLGVTIVRWFFDDGVAGKVETLNRPQFALMWSLLNGDVTTVVFEKLDRLSRELFVQELAIRDARKAGVTLISADEGNAMASNVDSQDVARKLYRQMMGVIGEYDKDSIVLRLRAARQRVKAADGRCEGQKPFTATDAGKLAMSRIRELRASGMGFDKIASHLNAEGIKTKRNGTQWHSFTINRMLTADNNSLEKVSL
jgi:DNA invertase Pin-like site-specific DNA recombinase